jgi:hypothetical protein
LKDRHNKKLIYYLPVADKMTKIFFDEASDGQVAQDNEVALEIQYDGKNGVGIKCITSTDGGLGVWGETTNDKGGAGVVGRGTNGDGVHGVSTKAAESTPNLSWLFGDSQQ